MAAADSGNSCKATFEHLIFSDLGLICLLGKLLFLDFKLLENLSGTRAGVSGLS